MCVYIYIYIYVCIYINIYVYIYMYETEARFIKYLTETERKNTLDTKM